MKKKEINIGDFLFKLYYTLVLTDCNEISLNDEILNSYVPQIEIIVKNSRYDLQDLFIKNPISNNYDQYKYYLINTFVKKNIGYINESLDTITLFKNANLMHKYILNYCDYSKLAALCAMELFVAMDNKVLTGKVR